MTPQSLSAQNCAIVHGIVQLQDGVFPHWISVLADHRERQDGNDAASCRTVCVPSTDVLAG